MFHYTSKGGGREEGGKLEAVPQQGSTVTAEEGRPQIGLEMETNIRLKRSPDGERVPRVGLVGPEETVKYLGADTQRTPGQLWLASRVQGREVEWLVDTGAVLTVIAKETGEGLHLEGFTESKGERMMGATGNTIKVYGRGELWVEAGGMLLPASTVIADIAFPAILGLDTLQRWAASIDTGNGVISIRYKKRQGPAGGGTWAAGALAQAGGEEEGRMTMASTGDCQQVLCVVGGKAGEEERVAEGEEEGK